MQNTAALYAQNPYINQLPLPIYMIVLQHLDIASLGRFFKTCKRFHAVGCAVLQDSSFWKQYRITTPDSEKKLTELVKKIAEHTWTKSEAQALSPYFSQQLQHLRESNNQNLLFRATPMVELLCQEICLPNPCMNRVKFYIQGVNKEGRNPLNEQQGFIKESEPIYGIMSPLYLATICGHEEIVKLLFHHRASLYTFCWDRSLNQMLGVQSSLFAPVHAATAMGNLSILSLFAAYPDYLNCETETDRNNRGLSMQQENCLTPLHIAYLLDKRDVIDFLLQNSANPNARSSSGKRPHELAKPRKKFQNC